MGKKIVQVKIIGLGDLERVLDSELPQKLSTKIMRGGLQKAGEIVRLAMVGLAPRDTGFLSEHFDVKTRIASKEVQGSAFIGPQGKMDYPKSGGYKERKNAKGKVIQRIGRIAVTSVARFFEFGTSKMPATGFMTKAFEQSKDQALEVLNDTVRAACAEVSNK